jgi:hypothetical protein
MEITIKENIYKIEMISVREQFHLMRKLTPAATAIIPLFQSSQDILSSEVDSLSAFAKTISMMPKEDADFCLFSLLSCVQRKEKHGLGFSAIASVETFTMHHQDIKLMEMMKIAFESLKYNFKDFFLDLQSNFPEKN